MVKTPTPGRKNPGNAPSNPPGLDIQARRRAAINKPNPPADDREHPLAGLAAKLRVLRRSRDTVVDFDVALLGWPLPATCPILGLTLDYDPGNQFKDEAVTIVPITGTDLVDGNVMIVSNIAGDIIDIDNPDYLEAVAAWLRAR